MAMKQRIEAASFIRKLETVSTDLAAWAQQKIEWGWTVEDIKQRLKIAATISKRDDNVKLFVKSRLSRRS